MKTTVLFIIMFLILITCQVSAKEQVPVILHKELGWSIDADENGMYNLFGEILGLSTARFYMVEDKIFLHVIRDAAGHVQIVIIEFSVKDYDQLVNWAEERITSVRNNNAAAGPLYIIKDEKWLERSVMKRLTLTDGTQFIVSFQKAVKDTLFAKTQGGIEMKIPDINIAAIKDLESDLTDSKFYRIDPNTSRMFFAPTGKGLPKGSAYFADYWVFFPTLAYGVTANFTISGGMSILPGADDQLLHLAPKLSFPVSPTVDVAAGLLYLTVPGEDDFDLSLGFAVATFGNDLKSLTLGVGVPITDFEDDNPLLLIGGETQVSNSVKFITENWIFPTDDGTILFSGGVRFFGEKVAVDLALVTALEAFDEGGWPFFPWVDFSYCFGR